MGSVRIEGLSKTFAGRTVLDVPSLEIADGEFFSLLGPSGCGKTTMLRSIAGLTTPDRGRVAIAGRDVTGTPTNERNLGMVFQKYALFPHLTIADNVAYGLRERGVARAEIDARVTEALALVAMAGFEQRYPHQLSGGQQQRVALARAVVYRPDVLLLDEPLSNLDVKLRVAMRAELKRLQRTLGITTIFVTHDQQEALALSDRIAVMRDGRIDQVGTPAVVYDAPASTHVAAFVGATNLIRGEVSTITGGAMTVSIEQSGRIPCPAVAGATTGSTVTIAVKPERVALTTPGQGLRGSVESSAYLGSSYSHIIMLGSQRIEAITPSLFSGEVGVSLDPAALRVFP